MMHRWKLYLSAVVLLLLALLTLAPAPVGAVGGGDTLIGVEVQLDGRYDDSRTYKDRCAEFTAARDAKEYPEPTAAEAALELGPYEFSSRRIGVVLDYEQLDGNTKFESGITFVRWWTRCLGDDGSVAPGSTDIFWVGVPRSIELVEPAYKAAMELVPAPNVSWPTKDPEFGWVYVNTSTEWRVDNLEPVSATARASNRIATAEATVTATPEWVTLLPGEPGAGIGRCTPEQAAAPFYVKIISQCSYKYKNSSAISPTSAFEAAIEVSWKVETDVVDVEPFDDLVTSWSEQLQVGEVQALVIADR